MKEEQTTHEFNLIGGYKDTKGVAHRHVVFGKSVTAKRLLEVRTDPQSVLQTQYQDLLLAESIVEFGTLPIPVPLTLLLSLNTIDRDDLRDGRDAFREKVTGGFKYEFTKDGVTLNFGIKVGDLRYTVIGFGHQLNGYDEVDADKLGLTEPLARMAFLAGRMVTRISTPEGNEIKGALEYETINSDALDEDDLFALVSASELWRQTFRLGGGTIQGNGTATQSGIAGAEVSLDRGAGSVPAG
jgi:hypothetical protein